MPQMNDEQDTPETRELRGRAQPSKGPDRKALGERKVSGERKPGSFSFLLPPVMEDEIGRLGNYRVLKLLGMGGMGMVFQAEDIALCRPVALKVMKPNLEKNSKAASQRFLREARAMAKIKHDNLVTIYQVAQENDTVYMAMELLDGETLESFIQRSPVVEVIDILRVGIEIATGLSAIHDQGLIHRDIKPANLWLETKADFLKNKVQEAKSYGLVSAAVEAFPPKFRVKILDFGLARKIEEDIHLTKTGMIVGTPAYLSPEQARGKPADALSDLFSLGCVLYTMCTKRPPFQADNTMSQLAALVADEPLPAREVNPQIPDSLNELVMSLLAKNPEDRPISAEDVANRLRQIERSLTSEKNRGIIVEKVEKTEKIPKKKVGKTKVVKKQSFWEANRAAVMIGSGLGVVVVGLLVVVIVMMSRGGPEPKVDPKGKQGVGLKGDPLKGNPGKDIAKNVPEQKKVYLTDFPQEKKSGINWPMAKKGPKDGFGKKKEGPDDKGPPPSENDPVQVFGKLAQRGIHMHAAPPDKFATSLSFTLDRKFKTFYTQVGLSDTTKGPESPMTFWIYGDGKVLWQSREYFNDRDIQDAAVDVTGISVLKLEVTCTGDPGGTHAAWIDPVLEKE